MEDGILTDSQGRRVDFKNTVIIMTSNIGARLITDKTVSFGFTAEGERQEDADVREKVLGELRQAFKPEFLNRVDDIIVFSKLIDILEISSSNLPKTFSFSNLYSSFFEL